MSEFLSECTNDVIAIAITPISTNQCMAHFKGEMLE